MSTDELADLREQARALQVDVAAALWGDNTDLGGYERLRAEIVATLNAKFMRGEELVKGPCVLDDEHKEYLLECVEEDGIPSEGQMVFVVEVRE